jgi:hypothetical protein
VESDLARHVQGEAIGAVRTREAAAMIATGRWSCRGALAQAESRWMLEVIHPVTNPLGRLTTAINLNGGGFYSVRRSDWDPENPRTR